MYMFCRSLFVLLYLFLLAIVLSVLLQYTDSDYPFSIFKIILQFINLVNIINTKGLCDRTRIWWCCLERFCFLAPKDLNYLDLIYFYCKHSWWLSKFVITVVNTIGVEQYYVSFNTYCLALRQALYQLLSSRPVRYRIWRLDWLGYGRKKSLKIPKECCASSSVLCSG
jgi:hypothetical protein